MANPSGTPNDPSSKANPSDDDADDAANPAESEAASDESSEWLIPGRYKDVDALLAAKEASDAEARRLVRELRSIQETRDVANPHKPSAWMEKLSEVGVPVDALAEAITEMSTDQIRKAFAPIQAAANARNTVLSEHPDFARIEGALQTYLASNPSLREQYEAMMATGDERVMTAAMNYVMQHHQTAKSREAFEKRADEAKSKKVEKEVAKQSASVPRTQNQNIQEEADTGTTVRDLTHAWADSQNKGDISSLAQVRLGRLSSIANHPHIEQFLKDLGEER